LYGKRFRFFFEKKNFLPEDLFLVEFQRNILKLRAAWFRDVVIPTGFKVDLYEGQGLCPWTPLEAGPPDLHLIV
jgi:hypothetical protein